MDSYSGLSEKGNALNPNELILPDYVKNAEEVRIPWVKGYDLIKEEGIRVLQAKFSDADVSLLIRDITSDVCVPTFAAVSDDLMLNSFDSDDFLDDIKYTVERLREVGLERVVVVDLTREQIGMPVVRVIVPGLEMYAVDGDRIGRRCKDARKKCGRVRGTES